MSSQYIIDLKYLIQSAKNSIQAGKEKLLLDMPDEDHDLIVQQLAVMDRQLEDLENELDFAECKLKRKHRND